MVPAWCVSVCWGRGWGGRWTPGRPWHVYLFASRLIQLVRTDIKVDQSTLSTGYWLVSEHRHSNLPLL